jgi:hypothetical protein
VLVLRRLPLLPICHRFMRLLLFAPLSRWCGLAPVGAGSRSIQLARALRFASRPRSTLHTHLRCGRLRRLPVCARQLALPAQLLPSCTQAPTARLGPWARQLCLQLLDG